MHESSEILGVEKIGKLLIQYSLPAIIGTAATSIYNIIDRIFIGQGVGPLAISGLALSLPLMNLAAAFGALVGVGAGIMVSIRLGQKDKYGAVVFLGNAFALNIIIGLLFSIVMLLFLDNILYAFGASSDTLPYAKEFMQIILAGNIFTHLYLGLNNIMRASGYPRKAMNITLITICINVVLAPLFIFVFHWGIRGAAAATVCAQFVGTVMVFSHFIKKHSTLHFIHGCFQIKRNVVKDIVSIGSSNFLMLICSSIVIMLFNLGLERHSGDYAIGAYGIINSIASLFIMIVLGLNQGMQPIAGYNYGARNFSRVIKVFQYALIAGSCVTILGFILMQSIPDLLSRMFTSSNELIELAVVGMRIFSAMFFLIGFQMVTANFFQALGKAQISIFLALTRQVLLLIPALLILPHLWGLYGVWMSAPVADFISSLLAFAVLRIQFPKLRHMKTESST
jgi:putative MATE family efflux protein